MFHQRPSLDFLDTGIYCTTVLGIFFVLFYGALGVLITRDALRRFDTVAGRARRSPCHSSP